AGLGLMVLRRRLSGQPGFTDQDRRFLFRRPEIRRSAARLVWNFSVATILCLLSMPLEVLFLAQLGPGLLAVVLLVTIVGIVNQMLG
ncbi:MAG TPA: hypothetical protein VFU31_05590, partial [Candidatus Binatia bacterium]|nr:hypothetical protein [Candidatus Binatia bacterium]